MRVEGAFGSLAAQRETLIHAETMLLVDDHQPQFAKRDVCLKQRMGADNQLSFTAPRGFERLTLRFSLEAAG